jgi:hypothetical protein
MTNEVFLDTSYAIALSSANDLFHQAALALADRIDTGYVRLLTTRAVLLEEAKQIVRKDQGLEQNGIPYGMTLLGLIPIGVGAAYLIFYYTGNKQRSDSQG